MSNLCRERYDLVKVSYWTAYEDYLRVTLIRSGDSVINQNEVGILPKRVEPRRRSYARPFRLQGLIESEEFFYAL